jgi:hypothetical protein
MIDQEQAPKATNEKFQSLVLRGAVKAKREWKRKRPTLKVMHLLFTV